MTPDHKHAISEIEREAKAIWMMLEGLSHSQGVDKRMIEAAKDAMQDMVGCARMAVK